MKHYFLGSNTAKGFKGYYNHINKNGNGLYILKGGSGVGKHTFMKSVGKFAQEKGLSVEYCHCSNDVNSLDGVIIKEIGIGLIDGTSPHITDPQLPGCFDEIIDLGKYIDTERIAVYKDRVARLTEEKRTRYQRAYTYLNCAETLSNATAKLILDCVNAEKLNDVLLSLPKSFVNKQHSRPFAEENIFASAYTSCGYVDYIGTLVKNSHAIGIKGFKAVNETVMAEIYSYAKKCGERVCLCRSPLAPHKIDHILFGNLSLISIDECNKYNEPDEIISLADLVEKNKIMDVQREIEWNNNQFDAFVEKAVEVMASCAELHKELESLYIPAMDFNGVNRELATVKEKINGYIEKINV